MNITTVKRIIAAAAMLLLSAEAGAQKMITFESRSSSSSSRGRYKSARGEDGKNSLTVGVGSMLNGYIPVYYERTLFSVLTIQVGAGITFRSFPNDLGAAIYSDGENSSNFNGAYNNDIIDKYSSYKYRKSSMGQYFSIAPKVYFNESALNGAYIGPMLEYKRFKYKAQLADVSKEAGYYYSEESVPRVAETMNEQMTCIDYTFNVGGHFQAAGHLAIGWNVGIGGRTLNAERLDVGILYDNMGGNSSTFVNATNKFSSTRPLFVFNFTMGGWF